MEIISCPVDRPQDSGRGEFTLSCCWDHSDFYTDRDDRNKSAIAPITRNNSHRISDNMIGQLSKIEETAMLATIDLQDNFTREDFMANPCDRMEWVDGQFVEKNGVTLKHRKIQSSLSCFWANYMIFSKQGGEVYISPPCRTNRQVRRPDVAYLTPELVAQFGDLPTLP